MSDAACYLYVLPTALEDIAKVGISVDPLVRARQFSPRYYETFDLSRSVLVAYDSRREARRREAELHRCLRTWNAMQPITVPGAAAGHTEWYRGAYDTVVAALQADASEGRVVHAPALAWWRARLAREREAVYEWGSQVLRDLAGAPPHPALRRPVADVLDAWAALGVPVDDVLPDELLHWYRGGDPGAGAMPSPGRRGG